MKNRILIIMYFALGSLGCTKKDCVQFDGIWRPKTKPHLSMKVSGTFRLETAKDGSKSLNRVSPSTFSGNVIAANNPSMGDAADGFDNVDEEFVSKGIPVSCP